MSNELPNGTVLPSGLLSCNAYSMADAYRKTFENYTLKAGIVVKSYDVSDNANITKKATEYDVMAFEQDGNKSSTVITYKNCIAMTSFGNVADFFEANLRKLNHKTSKGTVPSPSGQDGAIVLLLCLNGLSDKGIIVGSLPHPDRKTQLTDTNPHLEGEYNGVHVTVNEDGSTSLSFKGATDNQGNSIANPGTTEIKIEKDGSYQVDHSTVTFRMDKSGTASLTAKKDVDVTAQGNINFQIQGNANINVQGNISATSGGNTSVKSGGKVDVTSSGDTTITSGGKTSVTASGITSVTAPQITLNGASGQILTTVTDPFVDLITGFPTTGVPTVKAG